MLNDGFWIGHWCDFDEHRSVFLYCVFRLLPSQCLSLWVNSSSGNLTLSESVSYHFIVLHSTSVFPLPTPLQVSCLHKLCICWVCVCVRMYICMCVYIKVVEESHGQSMALCRLVAAILWVHWSQVHQPLLFLMLVGNSVNASLWFEQSTWRLWSFFREAYGENCW